MLRANQFLILAITLSLLCTTPFSNKLHTRPPPRTQPLTQPSNNNNNHNSKDEGNAQNSKIDTAKQKLTLIGYASEPGPARHLSSFAKRYGLDLHLIGVDRPWTGFNAKINGFYSFVKSIDNAHNESVILILDSYDTAPICSAQELLDKFNAFESDIVMSTGKDCWPDPNVETFLTDRLTEKEKETHKWFPWFLCPNSGAIMGRHDAMMAMFERVQQLVQSGNGSCNDFEGNKFSRNTQSDQRCYTSYYVELMKFNEFERLLQNESNTESTVNVIDISKITKGSNTDIAQSDDGSISKSFMSLHYEKLRKFYAGITMKLDFSNDLFVSMGGMMFMDFDVEMSSKAKHVSFRSKITNGTACILHGNGPGVILWRSYVKQIKNNGNLYVDDYVLRVGVDFFHWILWWIIMPCERLSHWLSVTYEFDIGFHSTTFSEEVIWRFHVWTFVAVVLIIGFPLLYWYKYKFIKKMKINQKKHKQKHKKSDDNISGNNNNKMNINKSESKNKLRKSNSFLNISNNSHPITQQLVKGLVNLEIMVHTHNGNTFPLLKTQKNS